MTEQEMIEVLDPNQTIEAKKISLITDGISKLDTPPCEDVIQALMRIIKKPTIPEASNGVYDEVVKYLKSICRY